MSTMTFGPDSTPLEFAVKHDDDTTQIRVSGSDYDNGSVVYDSQLEHDITLHVSNGSPTKWDLSNVSVKLVTGDDPNKQTYPVTMTYHPTYNHWVGTLPQDVAKAVRDGRLHVTATWTLKATGKAEPKDDPVIIVNPKNTN